MGLRPLVRSRRLVVGGSTALAVGMTAITPASGSTPIAARAAAAPRLPADDPAPGDPVPSAADLAAVRGLTSIDTLTGALLQAFPDSYGGLLVNESRGMLVDEGTSTVVVVTSEPQPGLADQLATEYGTDAIRVLAGGPGEAMGRTDDTPPRAATSSGRRCGPRSRRSTPS